MPCKFKVLFTFSAGAAVLAGLFATAHLRAGQDAARAPSISDADREFLMGARQISAHELQMGKLGVEHGTNGDLKMFAQTLVDDYTLATAEIEALARLKGVELANPPKPDTAVAELSYLSGLQFDQAFSGQSVSELAKIIGLFEKEEQSAGSDTDIQGFARSLLPKIRTQLQQARTVKL